MFDGARVLVTGASGLIGRNLVRRLVAEGARVRATVFRTPPPADEPTVDWMPVDLTRGEDCARAVAGMDFVFMNAASTAGAAVMARTPLAQVTPNVLMNTQMLQAAWEAKVAKFCFVSSSAAYPPSGDRPVREAEMFEGDPYDAYFAVGWMKRYAEVLCRTYAERITPAMPCVVIRPSNIYGPFDKFDPKTSHVTAALIRRVATGENPMTIWGTGDDVRDLIHVDDFLDGMLAVFGQVERFDAVNVASGTGVTVRAVLETLLDIAGQRDVEVRYDATKPQMIPIRLIDTTLAAERYGFRARIPLREGLARTLDWYRAHGAAHPR
ncbi:MAG: NAD-dependent epimerase/dehydratase family protein [Rhodospirillales bacterium]|jgi:GDP-L-fucose synthase